MSPLEIRCTSNAHRIQFNSGDGMEPDATLFWCIPAVLHERTSVRTAFQHRPGKLIEIFSTLCSLLCYVWHPCSPLFASNLLTCCAMWMRSNTFNAHSIRFTSDAHQNRLQWASCERTLRVWETDWQSVNYGISWIVLGRQGSQGFDRLTTGKLDVWDDSVLMWTFSMLLIVFVFCQTIASYPPFHQKKGF